MTNTNKEKHYCRICGFYNEEPPWGKDGKTPTYEICPCCGGEYGNDDYRIESIRNYREKWLSKEREWFDAKQRPLDWDLKRQLKNIPVKYL